MSEANTDVASDIGEAGGATDIAADLAAPLLDGAVFDDGRVWRWSKTELCLDSTQTEAVDRAIKAAERATEILKGDGDWRRRTRADRGTVDAFRAAVESLRKDGFDDFLTEEGFFKAKVWAARTGTQIYSDGRTMWGEYRSEFEVGSDASLRSWDLKPFCDDHPDVLVIPANYRQFVAGTCGQDAYLELPASDGYRYVCLTILVGDLATLIKIRGGKVELSAGYTAVLVRATGRDCNGIAYEYLQTKIIINHLALVEAGRAGPLARICVDGGAWQVNTDYVFALVRARTQPHQDQTNMSTQANDTNTGDDTNQPADAAHAGMGEMEEVDLGDGATVKVPKAAVDSIKLALKRHADKISAAQAEAKEKGDALAAAQAAAKQHADGKSELEIRVAAQDGKIAEQAGQLAVLASTVDAQAQRQEFADRKSILDLVAPVCPALVAKWQPSKNSPIADGMTLAEMKAQAVVDLAPSYAGPISAYKPKTDSADAKTKSDAALSAFIGPVFDHEIAQAETRRASFDGSKLPGSKPAAARGSLNGKLNQAVHGDRAAQAR
jgi:hypothetical protein